MQVIVDGRSVSYDKIGAGPVIVLLHGWADSMKTFEALTQILKKNYTVVSLDLAGFGNSQQPEVPWGLAEYAQSVKCFLDKIGINNVQLLVGHSNGGAIAIYLVAHHLLSPSKMVLLSSAGVRSEQSKRKKLLKVTSKIGRFGTVVLPLSQRRRLREKFYANIGSDLLIAPKMQETFKKIVSHDVQNEAKEIRVPTLLLYGAKDTATPVHYGTKLAACIPGSSLVTFNDAGHFIHQEQAKQVSEVILGFDS